MANRGESRITPDVARNYNLTPAASAVDKQLKYNPQLEDAARLKQTADGLAKLAKGMSDVDALMQRQAYDNALKDYAQKKGDETKKKWADVSHNIKGMAKFNPYNEDAYNALVCNDIGKKYINDLYADPELKYRSPEEVDAMINNLQNDMIAEFGSKGLAQRYYAKSLLDFKQHSDNLVLKHTSAHAEVKMQRTDNQISTTYSNVLLEGGEAEFTNTLDTVVLEGKGLGRTLEGNANNVINTVQKAIIADPSKFNSAFVLGRLKTYKVDGKPLTEIVPNLEGQVLKMVREAKNADLNDRKLEYETKQFDMQLKREEIATDFINQLNSGKLFTAQELQNWAVQMSEQAGLDGVNSIKLFHDLHTGQKTFMDLKQITSDPEVVLKLQQGIFTGETTALSLAEAMGNGTLGVEDAQKLGTQITEFKTKKQTQEIKRIDEHIKRATEEYTKNDDKTGRSAVLKTRVAKQELLNRMQILRGQYEEGKITYEQFNNKLAAVKSACREIERQNSAGQKTGMLAGYESLMSTPAISQEQWNRVDVARSTLAIRRMGIIKNSMNQDSKTVYIDSEPQAHRESTGTRHTGYDLGGRDVQMGKAVHCPVAGQVVGVLKGDNGGMGNMVLVRAKNGKLIKFMHLQYAGLPSLGSEISEDTVIGHVGNTGNVKNSSAGSLHFECYDENMQWITAWEFVR
jgi:murein DD-endopeptidase MepM/ murein hydrolase activator NlpD